MTFGIWICLWLPLPISNAKPETQTSRHSPLAPFAHNLSFNNCVVVEHRTLRKQVVWACVLGGKHHWAQAAAPSLFLCSRLWTAFKFLFFSYAWELNEWQRISNCPFNFPLCLRTVPRVLETKKNKIKIQYSLKWESRLYPDAWEVGGTAAMDFAVGGERLSKPENKTAKELRGVSEVDIINMWHKVGGNSS